MFRALLRFLERQPRGIVLALAMALVFMIFAVDLLTGTDVAVFLLYWLPISLTSWRCGRLPGILVAVLSTLAYVGANSQIGAVAGAMVLYWNTLIRLGSHVIAAVLIAELKRSFDRLHELSQQDFLTGVYNGRAFYRLAEMERVRGQRYHHAVTMVYVDVDNFKAVNDTRGHAAGDQLLGKLAQTIGSNLRRTDILARMGGDEFALLLPETDLNAGRQVLLKLQQALQSLVQGEGWPVTFSIGAVTYEVPPDSTEAMVRQADQQMYSVKKGSKNAIAHAAAPRAGGQRGDSSVSSAV